MRTIKELLELMLENKHLFRIGLCGWALDMYFTKKSTEKISYDEYCELLEYIEKNKPITLDSLTLDTYWWKPGDINPRIKWIEKHIKKNK